MSSERMATKTESIEKQQIPWSEIQGRLGAMSSVEGGNSNAERGIVELPEGKKIFVKVGVNEHTKGWANKEIRSYRNCRIAIVHKIHQVIIVPEKIFPIQAQCPE